MRGAVRGLELFAHGVFPALFPFAVCVGCLKRLGFFSLREETGFFALLRLLILGAIAGNPTGSMLMSDAVCGNNETNGASRSVYSALFNLASPVFIVGAVSSRIFKFRSARSALLLLLSHYASSLLLFIAYYFISKYVFIRRSNRLASIRMTIPSVRREAAHYDKSLIRAFPSALMDAVGTMLKLCGTIVFFVSFTELLEKTSLLCSFGVPLRSLIVGAVEMTNGLNMLACAETDMRVGMSLACFILSFGGVCIFMQANAVLRVDPPIYLGIKLAHGVCAFAICYLLFPLFISGSVSASSSGAEELIYRTVTVFQIALLCLIASLTASLSAVFLTRRTRA